jgi:uncharacterized membrane protein YhaH (DUF805 family)
MPYGAVPLWSQMLIEMKVTRAMRMIVKLFSFYGRTGRLGWWLTHLVLVPAVLITGFTLLVFIKKPDEKIGDLGMVIVLITLLLALFLSASSIVRRYHDLGKSGWWLLLNVVPGFGWVWVAIECGLIDGNRRANKYGPPPSEKEAAPPLNESQKKQIIQIIKAAPASVASKTSPPAKPPVTKSSKVESTGQRIARQFNTGAKKNDPTKRLFH